MSLKCFVFCAILAVTSAGNLIAPLGYPAAPLSYSAPVYAKTIASPALAYSPAPAVSYSHSSIAAAPILAKVAAPVATYTAPISYPTPILAKSVAPLAYAPAPIISKTFASPLHYAAPAPVATSYSSLSKPLTYAAAPVPYAKTLAYAPAPIATYAKTIATPLTYAQAPIATYAKPLAAPLAYQAPLAAPLAYPAPVAAYSTPIAKTIATQVAHVTFNAPSLGYTLNYGW